MMSDLPESDTQRQLAAGAHDALRGIRRVRLITTIALVLMLATEVTLQLRTIDSTQETLQSHLPMTEDDDGGIATALQEASREQKVAVLLGHALLYAALFGVLAISGQREVRLLERLDDASQRMQVLEGLLPICASCKSVRHRHGKHSDPAAWVPVESYVQDHSNAHFSHGLCPSCAAEAFREAGLEPPVEDPESPAA